MAIKFNIKKYEQIKNEYIEYLKTCNANAISLRNFEYYKIYLDADEEVKKARETICSIKHKQQVEGKSQAENNSLHQTISELKYYDYWEKRIKSAPYNKKTYGRLIQMVQCDINLNKTDRKRLLKIIDTIRNEHNAGVKFHRIINKQKKKKKVKTNTIFTSSYSGSVSSFYSCTYASKPISNYRKR